MDRGAAEVRIHGVSGTPPAAMLGLEARQLAPELDGCGRQVDPGADARVRVFGDPDLSGAHAFSWGRLTSGRASTALWLLLLPFVLVNVAGWAAMPGDTTPPVMGEDVGRGWLSRLHIVVVRLLALLVTAVVTQVLFLLVVDLVAWQWAFLPDGGEPTRLADQQALVLVAAVAVVAGLLILLWVTTRVRPRPPSPWGEVAPAAAETRQDRQDAAGRAVLEAEQARLWNNPGLISRLQAAHVTAAVGVLAIGAFQAASDPPPVLRWLAVLGLAAAVAWVAWRSLSDGNVEVAALDLVLAVGMAASAVAAIGSALVLGGNPRASASGALHGARDALPWTGGAALALVVLLLVVQVALRARARRSGTPEPPSAGEVTGDADPPASEPNGPGPVPPLRAVWTAPTLALLGLAAVATAGAGVALLVVRFLAAAGCPEDRACDLDLGAGPEWLALAATVALAALLTVAAVAYVPAWRWSDPAFGSRPMQALRRITDAPAAVLGWIGGVGLVAAVAYAAALLLHDGPLPPLDERFAGSPVAWVVPVWLLAVPVGAAAVWVLRSRTWDGRPRSGAARVLGLVVLVAVVVGGWAVVVRTDWTTTVSGLSIPPRTLRGFVVLVALLGPVAAMATRVLAGLRSTDVRRGVGVLWDLGLFWPRWFHPFTPPTYSDQAVTWYAAWLRRKLAEGHDPVLVSAHSQGSVIAVAALLLLDDEDVARVGLLTYGSPLGRLYGELFPAQVSGSTFATLVDRLGDGDTVRWRNLHRATDPIGGPMTTPAQDWLRSGIDPALLEQIDRIEMQGRRGIPDPCGRGHSGYPAEVAYRHARSQLLP